MPAPKPVMNLPPASNFWIGFRVELPQSLRAAAVEHPDALAVAVVDLDLDRGAELAAGRELGPVFLHLVGIGRGIGIGRLGVTRSPAAKVKVPAAMPANKTSLMVCFMMGCFMISSLWGSKARSRRTRPSARG